MKLLNLLIVVPTFLFFSCSVQGQNFSYSTKIYSIENNIKTDMRSHGSYISFPPYLFEFNIRVHQYDTVDSNSGQQVFGVTFDTGTVYIIDPIQKMFFEFNSFQPDAKIISRGQLQDKTLGVLIKENAAIEANTSFTKDFLRDTVAYGRKLLYYRSVEKDVHDADSVITSIFFLNQFNFISVHDIPNRIMKDRSYNMIGFYIHHVPRNESVSHELEELRPLNEIEEKICMNMINTMLASRKERSRT